MAELTEAQGEWLASAREMLDFLESRPELLPDSRYYGERLTVSKFSGGDRETFAALGRSLGTAQKRDGDTLLFLDRFFGPHTVSVIAHRDVVCERVVIGTETVEEPDPEAVAALPKVKVEREVVEWICPDSLLAPSDVVARGVRVTGTEALP